MVNRKGGMSEPDPWDGNGDKITKRGLYTAIVASGIVTFSKVPISDMAARNIIDEAEKIANRIIERETQG